MEPSVNQEGFGGSGGIGSFDLWPLSPRLDVVAVSARVAVFCLAESPLG